MANTTKILAAGIRKNSNESPASHDSDSRAGSSVEKSASESSGSQTSTTNQPHVGSGVAVQSALDSGHDSVQTNVSSEYNSPTPSEDDQELLSEDPFSSEESRVLFEAIDKMRMCGAGQDINLPQVSHNSHKTRRQSTNNR